MEAVGEERMALAQALEELSLALGPGGRVVPDAVSRQFKGRGQVNMFGFLDAAAGGQTGIALQGLRPEGTPLDPLPVAAVEPQQMEQLLIGAWKRR